MNRFEKVSYNQYLEAIGGDIDLFDEYNDIIIPKRATTGSAGYDFFAPFTFTLNPNETIKIPTGIRVILDSDKFLAMYPRSGLGFKFRLQLDNTVGIIDSDYCNSDNEGHIKVKLKNESNKNMTVKVGEGMCQALFLPFLVTDDDELGVGKTRNGGFGSTTVAEE